MWTKALVDDVKGPSIPIVVAAHLAGISSGLRLTEKDGNRQGQTRTTRVITISVFTSQASKDSLLKTSYLPWPPFCTLKPDPPPVNIQLFVEQKAIKLNRIHSTRASVDAVSSPTGDVTATTNGTLIDTYAQLSDDQVAFVNNLTIALNVISMICCVVVCITYFNLRRNHKTAMNRISLRLTMGAIAASFLFSISQMASDTPTGPSVLCVASVWAYIFFDLLTMWLVTMIAFNLHIVFVLGRSAPLLFEKWYMWISVILSCVSFIPLVFNGYGWEEKEQTCWYTKAVGTKAALGWEFGTYYAWVLIATVYCFLVITIVLLKIHKNAKNLAENSESAAQHKATRMRVRRLKENEPSLNMIRRRNTELAQATLVVKKVIWYPAVIIVTNILNLAEDINLSLDDKVINYPIYVTSFVATAVQGMLLCIVFCFDPALTEIWRKKKQKLIQRYYIGYNSRLEASRGRTTESSAPEQNGSPSDSRREVSFVPEDLELLSNLTRYDAVMNRLVTMLLVQKEKETTSANRSTRLRSGGEEARGIQDRGIQDREISINDYSQQSRDITSQVSNMDFEIDIEDDQSPTDPDHPTTATMFGLIQISRPGPALGSSPHWSPTASIANHDLIRDDDDNQTRSQRSQMLSSTITDANTNIQPTSDHQHRGSTSTDSTADSDTAIAVAPVSRVPSFLRQPARRSVSPSPSPSPSPSSSPSPTPIPPDNAQPES